MRLPEEFVVLKFYEVGHRPIFNKFNNVYQCACPICREGGSFNTKRRCYYIPKNDNVFCHNCGWSSKPYRWVKEVTGSSDTEIISELRDFTPDVDSLIAETSEEKPVIKVSTLPSDSINLSDNTQQDFYSKNPIVLACNYIIKSRRLDTACNRPDNLYVSLTDKVHKNRITIPFINERKEIEFYQTRTVKTSDLKTKPKYLGKVGAEKTLFNINKVSSNHDKVYIFEGPIDACFVRNSVAVAGITERGRSFTVRQQEQLDSTLKWYDKVWILDSQWGDRASMIKSEALLKQGESVFIWPETLGRKFKDFNDLAIAANKDEIGWDWIQQNTFQDLEGIVKMSEIKKFNNY